MTTVGAYEAKTHLSKLLDAVERGERIVITRHGAAVAVLVPPEGAAMGTTSEAIAELRAFRRGRRVSEEELRAWREEGRD